MQALLNLAAASAVVRRDEGHIQTVDAVTLVVGDVVVLTIGDKVPADLRLIESVNLEIDEAFLTGESQPVEKCTSSLDIAVGRPAQDRVNLAWSSTIVTKGRGVGVVVAIGMDTEIGTIANMVKDDPKKSQKDNPDKKKANKVVEVLKKILGLVGTPMQVKLSKFAIMLFGLAILLAIIVFSANKWDLHNEVILYGICVAVAVIPESLIAVMTVTIAVGVGCFLLLSGLGI